MVSRLAILPQQQPGQLRLFKHGLAERYSPVLRDKDGFAVLKDDPTGWLYLQNLVRELAKAHPKWTVLDFFHSYAPSTDGNDPVSYAKEVAGKLGVDYQRFLVSKLV